MTAYGDLAAIKRMLASTGTTWDANSEQRLVDLNEAISSTMNGVLGRRFRGPQPDVSRIVYSVHGDQLILPLPIWHVSSISVDGTVAGGVYDGGRYLDVSEWTPCIREFDGSIYALTYLGGTWGSGVPILVTGQWADEQPVLADVLLEESFTAGVQYWQLVLGDAPDITGTMSADDTLFVDVAPSLKVDITSSGISPNSYMNYVERSFRTYTVGIDFVTLSGYVYVDSDDWTGTLGLRGYKADGTPWGNVTADLPQITKNTWTHIVAELRPPSGATWSAFTCMVVPRKANRPGRVWFDRLYMLANVMGDVETMTAWIPPDLVHAVNTLVVETYKGENVAITSDDGLLYPRRNPWSDPYVVRVIERYKLDTKLMVL